MHPAVNKDLLCCKDPFSSSWSDIPQCYGNMLSCNSMHFPRIKRWRGYPVPGRCAHAPAPRCWKPPRPCQLIARCCYTNKVQIAKVFTEIKRGGKRQSTQVYSTTVFVIARNYKMCKDTAQAAPSWGGKELVFGGFFWCLFFVCLF